MGPIIFQPHGWGDTTLSCSVIKCGLTFAQHKATIGSCLLQAHHLTAFRGHNAVLQLLLDSAEVEAADKDGWQAHNISARNGHSQAVAPDCGVKVAMAASNRWEGGRPTRHTIYGGPSLQ